VPITKTEKLRADSARVRAQMLDAARERLRDGDLELPMNAIAKAAGVGVGTVYRHFPSPDDLIPACGTAAMEVVALPDPREAPSLFDGAGTPAERVERLVRHAFAIYERGAPELWVIRNEPGAHASVAQGGQELEASLAALVDAAVEPPDRAVARAMVDLGTWQALRDQSLGAGEAVDAVSGMLAARLA
jgi:AcrR family transcriptional regulator